MHFVKYGWSTNQNEIVIDPAIAFTPFSEYRDSYYSTKEDNESLKGMNKVLPSLVIFFYRHHLCARIDVQESRGATATEMI